MKRGLLLVDHGSRAPEANRVLEWLAALLATREPNALVRVAHMETTPPDIAEALAELAGCGVGEVVVYPHFLAPGRHVREDIPKLLENAARPFPALRVSLAEPLGAHEGLIDLVLERIAAAKPLRARPSP